MKSLKGLYEKFIIGLLSLFSAVRSQKGQALVEYALLIVLIAIVVYLMVKGTGRQVNCVYSTINSALGDV